MKLSDKTYTILKWISVIIAPALATFIVAMGNVWNLPYATQIAATITALATFLGAIIGISCANYNEETATEEAESEGK